MAILPILHFPDPRLRNKAHPVREVDDSVRALLGDMLETMYEAPGIGLAAPQVNISKRVIVIDISEARNQPLYLVNPEILARRGEIQTEEGCLSVPYIYEPVDRAEWIKFRAVGRDGQAFEMEVEGLLAVCVQHEIDHLEGKLFVDYLSEIKRSRIRKKLEKFRRKTL
jgi:peptide deformylase